MNSSIILNQNNCKINQNNELIQLYLRAVQRIEPVIIPRNYREALISKYSHQWKQAIDEEISYMFKNNVFEIIENTGQKSINTAFIFTYKKDTDQFKARLVARGDLQLPEQYANTYAPTMDISSLRILLTIALNFNLTVWNIDVKRAFLNANLKEEIFIRPPEVLGLDNSKFVIKLKKALYGLRQAGNAWYNEIAGFLKSEGFVQLKRDKTIFVHKVYKHLFLGIYVDDILIVCKDLKIKNYVINLLKKKYELHDLGPISEILGIRITKEEDCYYYDLSESIEDICNQFGIRADPKVKTPLVANEIIGPLDNGSPCDKQIYCSLIGVLLYIARIARLDILFPIIQLSQYRENPKMFHFRRLERILVYLKNTISYRMKISKGSMDLNVYTDANFATNYDYKSFQGTLVKFGETVIFWSSKKMTTVAQSTDESEIIAANSSLRELMYFKQLICEILHLSSYDFNYDYRCSICPKIIPKLLIDNQGTIAFCKNGFGKRTKYLSVKYIYLNELLDDDEYQVEYVQSKKNLADVFTKNLNLELFKYFIESVNLV